MQKIIIQTKSKKEVVNITSKINQLLTSKGEGICFVHIAHTTACLTTADLDPGTDKDLLRAYEAMIPKLDYKHPHDPSHVSDHLISSLVGNSVLLPFNDGKLVLGQWQDVVVVELNGPRERKLVVSVIKE